ncbi:MAG TPA: 2OG-Fe(II) oxygenase family protein, partial [Dongiaceae bacterium]|nr:2OG-Fe(II) oxygenase family protein [Dongiaceae bacterium]
PGLQARAADGSWIDVPPEEGTLAVNFGKLLERWTGGRIRATEHRVLGHGAERFSIPFFYDARADALIEPLLLPGAEPFAPFYFGDYLWATMTGFVEFQGLEGLRRPQGRL